MTYQCTQNSCDSKSNGCSKNAPYVNQENMLFYLVDSENHPITLDEGEMLSLDMDRNPDWHIYDICDHTQRLLGYSQADIKKNPIPLIDFVVEEDRDQLIKDLECLKNRSSNGVACNPCRFIHKNGNVIWFHIFVSKNETSSKAGWRVDLYNKTSCTLIDKIVQKKTALLKAASEVTHQLLTNTNFEESIKCSIKHLGESAKVDRVYVFENHRMKLSDAPMMTLRYEWVSKGTPAEIHNPVFQQLPYHGGFKAWYNILLNGETFVGFVDEMPRDIRRILTPFKIKSFIVVPIMIRDYCWGFIGFDDCKTARVWLESEKAILETVAASLGGAIQKEQMVKDLEISKASYKSVVDNIEEVIFQTNAQGECIYLNDAFKKITGYPLDACLGKNICEFFQEDKISVLKDMQKAIVSGRKKRFHKEFYINTITHSKRWVSITMLPQLDENGKIVGTFGTMMDSTKRKIAMDSILASEKKYRQISMCMSDYAYKIIPLQNGNIKFEWLLTGAFYKIHGYSPKEVNHRGWFDLIEPNDKVNLENRLKRLMEGEQTRTELKLKTKANKTVWVEDLAYPHFNEQTGKVDEIVCVVSDITERKEAEEKIKKSKEDLSETQEIAKVGGWELDLNTMMIKLSKEHQHLIENNPVERSMPLNQYLETYVHKSDITFIRERLNLAIEHPDPNYHDRFEYRLKPSRRRPIKHLQVLGRYKTDGIIRGITQDITERKLAEERIIRSEEKYKTIFNSIQDVYAEVSIDGLILEISPSIQNVGGYTREEVLGKNIETMYASRSDRHALLELLKKDGCLNDYEVKLRHKDGSIRVCSFNITVIFDEHGRPMKSIGTMRDITERKLAEKHVSESEQKYRLLANNAVDIIWQTDLSLAFTYVSPSIHTVTGYSVDEFVGTKLGQHVSFKEFIKCGRHVVTALKNYNTFTSITFESRMTLKNGQEIPIEITGRLLLNEHGRPVGLQGTTKDISERKQSEEKLKIQEARTRAINRAIPDFLIEVDEKGNYLNTNHQTHAGYQICDHTLTGSKISETKPKKLREQLIPAFDHARKTGEIQIFETCIGQGSKLRCVEVRIVPTQMKRHLIIIRDITSRIRSEQKINEQLHFLQQLIDSIPNPIFFKDLNGRYLGCNKEFENYIGFERKDIIGKTVYDISPTANAKLYQKKDQELFKTTKDRQVYESTVLHADGRKHDVMFHKAAFFDTNNKPLGLVGSMLDITERKKMECQLIDQKLFFQHVIDTDPNIILVLNKDNQVKLINQSAANFFGLPKEFFLNNSMGKSESFSKNMRELFTHDETIIDGESCEINITELKRLDNEERQFSIIKKPLKTRHGEICELKIASDITTIKQKQLELQQLLKDLKNVNKELKEFAYIVSHDLKAPLRAIGSLSNWLYNDYADKLDDDGKENLELLVGRVKRMHDLIEGILQYSRIGRVKETPVDIQLSEIIDEVVDLLAPPDHFTVNVETSLPIIKAERTRILQVFQNLISNAIKYNDKPKGNITIGCLTEDGQHKIYVKDNGPGIDEKYHEKIFQIFQTLSARDEHESTGIGLTIVKKIIENIGGNIVVESTPNIGTTFWINLPVAIKIAA